MPRGANPPAPGISYYTPVQNPPAGTAIPSDDKPLPKLFQPLKLRGVTLQNRIMLSPLCQHSAEDGHMTAWHFTHLGGIIQRGPGLTFVEATAILPEGRITPEDLGLWKDSQMAGQREMVEFAHSQCQKIGIQLAHAGRKASLVSPWIQGDVAPEELGGWPNKVYGPSAVAYDNKTPLPREMTEDDIRMIKKAYVDAVKRALACGFDVIEIHSGHGYLLHSFHSPVSNKRTDRYGGSFENRICLTCEIVDMVRQIIPPDMPLFLRVSGTDWLEETDIQGWDVDQTVKLAEAVALLGVDLIDVSSGGSSPAQKIKAGPSYQAPYARAVKKALGTKVAVGTVGQITSGKQANGLLEEGLDLVIVGRMFQKNPGLVWTWAEELDVEIKVANQIGWGFVGRGKG